MSRQVQQNLLSTNANGLVSAVFPGGVEMRENDDFQTTALPGSMLKWTRDGRTRGYIFGSQGNTGFAPDPTQHVLDIGVTDNDANTSWTELQLFSKAGPVNHVMQLAMRDPAIPDIGHVLTRTLLSGDGASQFLQLFDARKTTIAWAHVRGSDGALYASSGVTSVTHLAVGDYQVNLANTHTSRLGVAMPVVGVCIGGAVLGGTGSMTQFRFYDAAGTVQDTDFMCVLIGWN